MLTRRAHTTPNTTQVPFTVSSVPGRGRGAGEHAHCRSLGVSTKPLVGPGQQKFLPSWFQVLCFRAELEQITACRKEVHSGEGSGDSGRRTATGCRHQQSPAGLGGSCPFTEVGVRPALQSRSWAPGAALWPAPCPRGPQT